MAPLNPVPLTVAFNDPCFSNDSHISEKLSLTAKVGLFVLADNTVVVPLLGNFPGRASVKLSSCPVHTPFTPIKFSSLELAKTSCQVYTLGENAVDPSSYSVINQSYH